MEDPRALPPPARRRTQRARVAWDLFLLAAIACVAAALTWPDQASAEPYMAIREGRRCSACHVNMTGAGMRTELANAHLEEITRYRDIFPQLGAATDAFTGQITRNFSIGGDLRVDDSIVFQDQPNAQGKVANDKVFRGNVEENILQVRRAPLYFKLDLLPDYLLVYLDENFAPGSPVTRELFGLLRGVLPWKGWVKAGKFFPDYGLRTENDNLFSIDNTQYDLFVRGRTGTTFTSYDEGAEIGFMPGPLVFDASVSDGASGDTNVRVTANVYTVLRDLPVVRNLIVGGSMLHVAPDGRDRIAWCVYGGSNLGPFTYLAEADFIHDDVDATDTQPAKSTGQFLVYGEINYLLLDWINTKAFGEYADSDPASGQTNSALNRFGIGIEPFLGRYIQPRLYYSFANGVPTVPEANQSRLIFELHIFF